MKRQRGKRENLGPATAALRRRSVFRDTRASSTQLTAAQLIADAQEMQRSIGPSNMSTTVVINSPEELALYRQKTRGELEEKVKRGYAFLGNWVKYAKWEAQQKDYERMRAVLERAVKFHGANPVLWRDYAELEEEGGFINHARAVWERGVAALPSVADLWLKYIVLEEAAGQDDKVRDLFNRWITSPAPPQCSWELFALFEAQQQQTEACRDILRRYVEAYGSVECWLFYGNTELSVFKDADRAALVYETAMKSLPSEYVNGMKDIRIPLARADALVAAGRYDEAREFYHSLLKECTSVNALDDIFTAYKRFERLHGKSENHEAVASLIARAMYQQRIVRNPCDLDAHVSLFLILRETARGGGVSDKGDGFAAVNSEALWGEALQCLSSAVNVHVDVGTDTISAQKHAVVVMAFARLAEACGDVTSARAGLAECIRRFPFKLASCPRLWIEASSLEERHRDFAQARKLLGASLNISACPELFDAALQLEKNACTSGEVTPEDCVNRSRAIYQSAIKQFPHDLSLWEGYAKMEEQEEQFCRSDALRSACIRSFTVAARALASMTDRYEMLGKVDQVWAKRLALKRRLLRSAKKKLDGSTGETNAVVEEISSSIKNLYRELLDSVWDEYKYEALCWWKKIVATTGVLSPPPPRLPEALSPPIARWTEAVSAVTSFIVTPTQYDSCCDPSSAEWMRTIFRDRFERERPELLRELGGLDDNASFEAIQQSKRWVEFLLSPNGTEWRRFEATYGTPETLEASKEYMQPTVRRTRLFRQKRAS